MIMSWVFLGMVVVSFIAAVILGQGAQLAAAIAQGAQAGITLSTTLAGSLCLWSGVGKLLEKAGFTEFLSCILRPILVRVFPATKEDPELAGALSANICANFLGLGNAATPMGIRAAKRLATLNAQDELCRLIVLNTASIQLIPATVATIRSSLGASAPFNILPAVWLTSLFSAGIGLLAAWFFGKIWKV